MLACIIIEDQPPAQRILKKYISNADNLILKGTFSNPLEAKNYLLKEKIDLIFLDIHLPKMSGLEFLKSVENHPKVILTTAYGEYALESYEYNVIDYLLKPFSYDRFLKSIQKVSDLDHTTEFLKNSTPNILYIKTGYEVLKIDSNEIYYIKSDGDYTEIFMETKKILTSDSLKNWLEKLKSLHPTSKHTPSFDIKYSKKECLSALTMFFFGLNSSLFFLTLPEYFTR